MVRTQALQILNMLPSDFCDKTFFRRKWKCSGPNALGGWRVESNNSEIPIVLQACTAVNLNNITGREHRLHDCNMWHPFIQGTVGMNSCTFSAQSLDSLNQKAKDLSLASDNFKMRSESVRKQQQKKCRNMFLIYCPIILIIGALIAIFACGGPPGTPLTI